MHHWSIPLMNFGTVPICWACRARLRSQLFAAFAYTHEAFQSSWDASTPRDGTSAEIFGQKACHRMPTSGTCLILSWTKFAPVWSCLGSSWPLQSCSVPMISSVLPHSPRPRTPLLPAVAPSSNQPSHAHLATHWVWWRLPAWNGDVALQTVRLPEWNLKC